MKPKDLIASACHAGVVVGGGGIGGGAGTASTVICGSRTVQGHNAVGNTHVIAILIACRIPVVVAVSVACVPAAGAGISAARISAAWIGTAGIGISSIVAAGCAAVIAPSAAPGIASTAIISSKAAHIEYLLDYFSFIIYGMYMGTIGSWDKAAMGGGWRWDLQLFWEILQGSKRTR